MPPLSPERMTIGVLPGWEVYENATLVNYLGPLLHGIRSAAVDQGCNLIMACGLGLPGGQIGGIEPAWPISANDTHFIPVLPSNTDGLIVINPLISKVRMDYILKLQHTGHPIVFIGAALGGPAIGIDNSGGIQRAIEHLVEHGHRRIAFIAGSPNDLHGDSEERLQAYQYAMEKCGLETDSNLIVYGLHIVEGGRLAMQQLLNSKVSFTAVVGSSDECAIGAMQILRERGYRIPEDIAVIGFDDQPEALIQDPPLTSVHSPTFERGYRAIGLMQDRLTGRNSNDEIVIVPARLMIRQSCGCLQYKNNRPAMPIIPRESETFIDFMEEAVLKHSRTLGSERVHTFCAQLANAFLLGSRKDNPQEFYLKLSEILKLADAAEDDLNAWLASISVMRDLTPDILEMKDPIRLQQAANILSYAASLIDDAVERNHQQALANKSLTTDRMSTLASHLFSTQEEYQILNVLTEHLPELGIPHAALVFYEPEGEDPFIWSVLRTIPGRWETAYRFPTRKFPPQGVYPPREPYNLALIPMVIQERLAGFIAFDSTRLDLYGSIVQQVSLAFQNVNLYRQAIDGRRLAEEGRRLAEDADQMKSRFLSTVSHELRTPLTVIAGLSADELKRTEPVLHDHEVLEKIHISACHLDSLISDVLDLAQNQVGQLKLVCESLDPVEVLQTVIVIGEELAREKGLVWEMEIPSSLPRVWGDRIRLRQVFLNLVNNAIKFTEHGKVRLSARVETDRVIIQVSDTGLGIPPNEQAIIFDEFFQSERTARRGYGGLGLGLAISKRLIELHNGEISVQSSGVEGAGSQFTVNLPIIREQIIEKHVQLAPSETVLILSSPSGNGVYLKEELSRQGYHAEVININSSGDWRPDYLSQPFGQIILDGALSPEFGWQVLKTLKELPSASDTPVLFYSLSPEDKTGSLLSLNYLKKPIGAYALDKALKKCGLSTMEGHKTILIVDDDPAILDMHTQLVQGTTHAWHVLSARDGREALMIVHKELPDVILLDLMMPELDGFGVLEALQSEKTLRNIPVIVLTGQTLTEADMQKLNRGVTAVLNKGVYGLEETLSCIANALQRSSTLGNEKQRLARRAIAYIHEHYANPIHREDIAEKLGANKDYLTRCFSEETGLTMTEYIHRYRINQAKALLAEGGRSITDIALAVGFSDSNYFTRLFRKEMGISPRNYRRS